MQSGLIIAMHSANLRPVNSITVLVDWAYTKLLTLRATYITAVVAANRCDILCLSVVFFVRSFVLFLPVLAFVVIISQTRQPATCI